jgi:mannose-1-phosphate guanylyltransferase/mannose-6-phosphate isomerase
VGVRRAVVRALLMAGGSGTRLWPLSTEEHPKQFLKLLSQKSLLRETYERVAPAADGVFVATASRYLPLVRAELPEVPEERILPEPSRRNSGPAVLAAALRFARDGDPVTAAIPSDQTVADADSFRRALAAAAAAAERCPVVVLAVPPSRPDTDYGYLELSEPGSSDGIEVRRFIEKPAPAEAEEYVRAGYFWNAGIFVFRPSRLLAEARRVAPSLLGPVERFLEASARRDEAEAVRAYDGIPAISFDYAVMEKASGVGAVPLRAGWSDVGTWRSVRDLKGASDESGNLFVADAPVLALGLRDCAIVASDAGILVLPFEREAEVRAAVERLRRGEKGRPTLEDTAGRSRNRR